MSVRLQTKWLWVRVLSQSLDFFYSPLNLLIFLWQLCIHCAPNLDFHYIDFSCFFLCSFSDLCFNNFSVAIFNINILLWTCSAVSMVWTIPLSFSFSSVKFTSNFETICGFSSSVVFLIKTLHCSLHHQNLAKCSLV